MSLPLDVKFGFGWDHQQDVDTGYFPAKLNGKEGFDIKHLGVYWNSGKLLFNSMNDSLVENPISQTKLPNDEVCPNFEKLINQYTFGF